MQFATNHLGHFALRHRPAPGAGRGRRGPDRLGQLAAHLRSPVVFEDIHFERRPYEPWEAYGQSKTANVLFAVEATRRWADDGILANALMPGAIRTNLQRYISDEEIAAGCRRGATALVLEDHRAGRRHLGAGRRLAAGRRRRRAVLRGLPGGWPGQAGQRRGVAPYALDPEAAERLWQVSVDTLKG